WLGKLPFFTNLVNQLDTISSWFFSWKYEVWIMTNNIENTTVNDSGEIQAARERVNDLDKSIVDLLKKRFQASARI
ncbi:hypothetical protein CBI42_12155, partial [Streptococcus sp. KR]